MQPQKGPDVYICLSKPGHILIRYKYSHAPTLERIRCLHEIEWNVEQNAWEVPLKNDTIPSLRNIFRKRLKYSRDLLFTDLMEELKIRRYSSKTLKSYIQYNRSLLLFSGKKSEDIQNEDIRKYLLHLHNKNISQSAASLATSSLQFYYGKIKHKSWAIRLEKPRKERTLPDILSKTETLNIIKSPKSLKHRALLTITYAAGLRVSEVVTLKVSDIDFERSLLHIRSGKGKKDRYSILGKKASKILQEYISVEKPDSWLFPGQYENRNLSVRSAEKIFEHAKEKCRINKNVTIHSLRHAFASHLLENGTDIRYIQKLLGHASVQTTQMYTHVTVQHLDRISSPLDRD